MLCVVPSGMVGMERTRVCGFVCVGVVPSGMVRLEGTRVCRCVCVCVGVVPSGMVRLEGTRVCRCVCGLVWYPLAWCRWRGPECVGVCVGVVPSGMARMERTRVCWCVCGCGTLWHGADGADHSLWDAHLLDADVRGVEERLWDGKAFVGQAEDLLPCLVLPSEHHVLWALQPDHKTQIRQKTD